MSINPLEGVPLRQGCRPPVAHQTIQQLSPSAFFAAFPAARSDESLPVHLELIDVTICLFSFSGCHGELASCRDKSLLSFRNVSDVGDLQFATNFYEHRCIVMNPDTEDLFQPDII